MRSWKLHNGATEALICMGFLGRDGTSITTFAVTERNFRGSGSRSRVIRKLQLRRERYVNSPARQSLCSIRSRDTLRCQLICWRSNWFRYSTHRVTLSRAMCIGITSPEISYWRARDSCQLIGVPAISFPLSYNVPVYLGECIFLRECARIATTIQTTMQIHYETIAESIWFTPWTFRRNLTNATG